MTSKYLFSVCLFCFVLGTSSCKKYLETKSVQTLSTPGTLDDLQLLMDNPDLNFAPSLINVGTDEYYVHYPDWQSLGEIQQKGYIWHADLNNYEDWNTLYRTVYYANTVLFNLNSVETKGQVQRKNNIKGIALFHRAFSFYQIAQLYAKQYDKNTASLDLGIPLRLNADFNEASKRSTVQQTYDQIIQDLKEALNLLPESELVKTRPSKAACYALLARTYLQMNNYTMAKENANVCLQKISNLIDYNNLSTSATYPFPIYHQNSEIIYYYKTDAPLNADDSRARIDSNLYSSYHSDDLRRACYFRDNGDGSFSFKGNYSGDYDLFNGLATDELYLIRAECFAREGNTSAALQDLNKLLINRWSIGTFVPFAASSPEDALSLILKERKKELIYRGTRWSDIRRLNQDIRFATDLKRELNNQIYVLSPNDLRYVLLIPQQIINLTNLQQNPR